jgi:hypothetical protein
MFAPGIRSGATNGLPTPEPDPDGLKNTVRPDAVATYLIKIFAPVVVVLPTGVVVQTIGEAFGALLLSICKRTIADVPVEGFAYRQDVYFARPPVLLHRVSPYVIYEPVPRVCDGAVLTLLSVMVLPASRIEPATAAETRPVKRVLLPRTATTLFPVKSLVDCAIFQNGKRIK